MKNFRKTSENLFICEECGKIFKICSNLSAHVGMVHGNKKEYYDKWIKTENEGICPTCNKETKYSNRWDRGYDKYCCRQCKRMSEETIIKMLETSRKTCLKLYGVDSFMLSAQFKEKRKITWLHNYGVDNPLKNKNIKEKGKQTKKDKYGSESYNNSKKRTDTNIIKYGGSSPFASEKIKEKAKKTCIKKYNVDHPFKNPESIEKRKHTWINNYDVEHPSQNKQIYEKGQKSRLELHQFKNTELYYQGSYELDFLEKYYDNYPDIVRGPSIKYMFNNKNKIYHPDFFIPSLNLIVEIKSSWTYNNVLDNIKKEAVIANGFNYLIIIDKNYLNNYFI